MADDRLPQEPGPDAGIDELQSDIEKTRSELGDTVGALSDKLDVKSRAQHKAAETKHAVAERAHETKHAVTERAHVATEAAKSKPAVPTAAIVALAAAIGFVWWWRRR